MRNKLGLPPDYEPSIYIIDDEESIRTSVESLIQCNASIRFQINIHLL